MASIALLAVCALYSPAQEELPQIVPLEKKTYQNQKKDLGPRALGLLQMTSQGKVTLVPVAILINGKFYDATAYKATPIPWALESGTIYEGERTGKSIGLFTVNGALHSETPNTTVPWLGSGSWLPTGTEAPRTTRKAENVPVGIEGTDEGPPRLSKAPPAPTAPATPTSPPQASTPPPAASTPPTSTPRASSVPQQPSTPAPASAPPAANPPAASPTSPSAPKAEPPAAQSTAPVVPPSDSGAGESNRPVLRRGRPTEPLPDDDVPGYSRPGAAKSASAKAAAALTPMGAVEIVPAISDAAGPEPHSFIYEWTNDEERDRIKQMLAMASDRLREYLATQARQTTTTKRATMGKAREGKPSEPVFENVKLRTFDLWGNNQPVLVLSAEAHFPPASGVAPPSVMTYDLTLGARTDIYSNLHKLYAGITDKYHLDVTPRLELIDAVDADGDGRGELMFRETSDLGSGYVIYRATADSLWKMFDSFNQQ